MLLKVGEYVVYPAHGVGRVETIHGQAKDSAGSHMVVLRMLDSSMEISIPTRNLDEVGLRPLISKKEVSSLYEQLKVPPVISEASNWNRRHRNYLEKLKSGDLNDVCDVLRELMTMRGHKELSFGERKLLDTARALIIKELAMVTKNSELEISDKLDSFFPPSKTASL